MDQLTAFEQRLEDRVRAFALTGVRPVDSASLAHALAVQEPRGKGAGSSLRWPTLPLDRRVWAIAAALGLLVALLGGAVLIGARAPRPLPLALPPAVTNGWIAFTVQQPASAGLEDDLDIWLVGLGREARRVIGDEADRVDQLCPAFSPDGRSLAYGRVEGHGTNYFMNADGTEGAQPADYRQAALVVADVSDDGHAFDWLTVDVGAGLPPPCPVWSPDGRHIAFGVNHTSPINPTTSATGSAVWIVTLADRGISVLPDLLATDLHWSPDGSTLAIASGTDALVNGEALQDGRIHLFRPASGAMRSLEPTGGAVELAWSADGGSIAYASIGPGDDAHRELRLIDVATGRQRSLAARYGILHGIGPVWSPDGRTIVYQRGLSGEHSEAVLVMPGDLSDERAHPVETVVPLTARGSGERLDPYRVTWSPDGRYLLMMAWGHPPDRGGTVEDPFLAAVSLDPAMPSVVLARGEGLVVNDGYPDTTLVPIQTWGRVPAD